MPHALFIQLYIFYSHIVSWILDFSKLADMYREEVSRLLEILQSRALEPSNKVDGQTFSPQSIEKQVEQPSAANRVLKIPHEGKQEDLERTTWGNLTPHPHSSVSRVNP